jgi:hypothetical protein
MIFVNEKLERMWIEVVVANIKVLLKIFFFILALGPTQPPIQLVPAVLSLEVKRPWL